MEIDLGDDGMVCHAEGAMMYWIENSQQLKHYGFEMWGMNKDVSAEGGVRKRLVGEGWQANQGLDAREVGGGGGGGL